MTSTQIPRETRPSLLRHVDYFLPVITLVISAIGVLMVYSATRGPDTLLRPAETRFLERQLIFTVIGAVAMIITAWIGHRLFQRFAPHLYTFMLAVLFLVLIVGVENKGTKAWFQVGGYQLQPSEFGKIVLIVALAAWYGTTNTASGRKLIISTNQPGIQFYSGNHLSRFFNKNQGLCLETQHFPDSPNNDNFPTTILMANEEYYSETIYLFDLI